MYRCKTRNKVISVMNHNHNCTSIVINIFTADGVEVPATICTNYGGGCDWEHLITIRRCTDENNENFYIYKLVPPESCPTGYCAGQFPVCENPAEFYDPDLEECVGR